MLLLITADPTVLTEAAKLDRAYRQVPTTRDAIDFLDAPILWAPRASWQLAYGPDILDDPRQRAVPDVTGSVAVHVPRIHGRGADMTRQSLAGMVRLGIHTLVALPAGSAHLLSLIAAQVQSANTVVMA